MNTLTTKSMSQQSPTIGLALICTARKLALLQMLGLIQNQQFSSDRQKFTLLNSSLTLLSLAQSSFSVISLCLLRAAEILIMGVCKQISQYQLIHLSQPKVPLRCAEWVINQINITDGEVIIIKRMMNASDMMLSMTSKGEGKLGYTTTVKEQVDEIENNLEHFKKILDNQRKQQNELDFQLRKLEQQSKTNFTELNKQMGDKVNYLSELFKSDTKNQNKQFDYLELQNSTLQADHEKLQELTTVISSRTQEVENTVGF